MILPSDLKPKGCGLMTGEANMCQSCSLTIVTELAHDMGKCSLPVLVLSQKATFAPKLFCNRRNSMFFFNSTSNSALTDFDEAVLINRPVSPLLLLTVKTQARWWERTAVSRDERKLQEERKGGCTSHT